MQNSTIKNLIKFIALNYCNGFATDRNLWRYNYLRLKYNLSIFTYFNDSPSIYDLHSSSVELLYNKELIKIESMSTLLRYRLTNFRYSNKKYYIFNLDKEKLLPLDNSSNMQLITLENIPNRRFRKDTLYFVTLTNVSIVFHDFFLSIEKIFTQSNYSYETVLEIIDNLFPAIEIMLDRFKNVKLNFALAFSSDIYKYHEKTIDPFVRFVKTLNHIRFDDFYYDIANKFKDKLLNDENDIFAALVERINENTSKSIFMKNGFRQDQYSDQDIIKLINEFSLTEVFKAISSNYIIFEDANSQINTKDLVLSIVLLNNMLRSL